MHKKLCNSISSQEIIKPGRSMRDRSKQKGTTSKEVAIQVARLYNKLKEIIRVNKQGNIACRNSEDIFQDTILYVIHDKFAMNLNDEEFIKHFTYRHQMIVYQNHKDNNQLKEIEYADYKQAKENTDTY